jgi:fibronectin-binding autotransporter adhesin
MKKIIVGAIAMFFAMVPLAHAQSTDYSLSASGWTNGPAGTTTYTGTQNLQAGPNAWAISPYTGSTMVGLTPTNPTASYNTMTTALGMSSASVTALSGEIAAQNPQGGGNITNAAWIYKDFPLAAATKFSMYWVYTSTDYVPFNDGSITTFVNTGGSNLGKINNVLTQYILLGATNPGTGNYSTGSYGSTGWQIVNYEAVDAGTYRLGFASFNQGDTALSPVLYVNDGLGTVTKNGQTFGAVAPNDPNMPTVDPTPTPSNPTVVSTTPTTPTVASSTTYGAATTANLVTVGSTNTGSKFSVTQTTTPVTATPYTITTVTTPKVIQTWSDNTTTTIIDPNNPATTTTQIGTAYQTGTSSSATKSVSSVSVKESIKTKNMNLFLVDPLSQNDGSWATPYMGYISSVGNYRIQGAAFGWQRTVENNTFGMAANMNSAKNGNQPGSGTDSDSYSGTVYLLSKQPGVWLKAAVGYGSTDHKTTTAIPAFALTNSSKVNQNNFYADLGGYSPETFYGFRLLGGAIVNYSDLKGTETGSPLLSTLPKNGGTTKVLPYVGARYENGKAAVETRIYTNTEYKTVVSTKASINQPIADKVYLNATVGVDKAIGAKYNNVYGLIGLKIIF